GEDLAVLRHVGDAALDDAVGALPVDRRAVELDGAVAVDDPEHRLDGGGLADTVAAEQSGDAGRCNGERDVLDDLLSADARIQALDPKDRLGGCCHQTASPR